MVDNPDGRTIPMVDNPDGYRSLNRWLYISCLGHATVVLAKKLGSKAYLWLRHQQVKATE